MTPLYEDPENIHLNKKILKNDDTLYGYPSFKDGKTIWRIYLRDLPTHAIGEILDKLLEEFEKYRKPFKPESWEYQHPPDYFNRIDDLINDELSIREKKLAEIRQAKNAAAMTLSAQTSEKKTVAEQSVNTATTTPVRTDSFDEWGDISKSIEADFANKSQNPEIETPIMSLTKSFDAKKDVIKVELPDKPSLIIWLTLDKTPEGRREKTRILKDLDKIIDGFKDVRYFTACIRDLGEGEDNLLFLEAVEERMQEKAKKLGISNPPSLKDLINKYREDHEIAMENYKNIEQGTQQNQPKGGEKPKQ